MDWTQDIIAVAISLYMRYSKVVRALLVASPVVQTDGWTELNHRWWNSPSLGRDGSFSRTF